MPIRYLSPLEQNHLRKFGFSDIDPVILGEKPVEYITGHAEFCGLDFLVNEFTLIPRLESEMIIQIALEHIAKEDLSHPAIADIGTGSGCLGLSLATKLAHKQIPYSVYLSDLSSGALAVAKKNAERLLSSPVNLFFEQSDLFSNFPKIKFDIIMANLPYIPSKNIPHLSSSVKDFEPHTALDGGPYGTTIINRLLHDLPIFLSKRGVAILEINDSHSLEDFIIPSDLSVEIKTDLFKVPRFLTLHPRP